MRKRGWKREKTGVKIYGEGPMKQDSRGGEKEKAGKSEGRNKGTDTQRKPYQVVWFPCAAGRPWRSPPSAGHLDCRELLDLLWMEEETEGGRDRGIGGRERSGQLVLLIKAQWPKRDHLLAGARTGSRRCLSTSFCSRSVQPALHCKPLVDFNASKCSNRDRTECVQHTHYGKLKTHKDFCFKMKFQPSGRGDNCFHRMIENQ